MCLKNGSPPLDTPICMIILKLRIKYICKKEAGNDTVQMVY